MDEYIKRSEVLDLAYWHGDRFTVDRFSPDGSDAVDAVDIENIPAAEVVLVVHGKWVRYPDCGVTKCSNCGWSVEECWDSKWCPECGAKMD